MTEVLASALGLVALGRMALAVACCASPQATVVGVCGEPGHVVRLPIKRGKAPGDEPSAGCHAVCGRKFAVRTGGDCPDC
jgi:hypothetical protein